LFNGAGFGFMRGAAFGHRLIDEVGDAQQALAQARTVGETLIETRFVLI